jgi:hypothetical protein
MSNTADYSRGEPEPVKNNGPSMHDLLVEDIKNTHPNNKTAGLVITDVLDRKDFGLLKYGTPLQANNGRNPLRDAYEEILDCLVYIKQALEEARTTGPNIMYREALALAFRLRALIYVEESEYIR